MCAGIFLNQEVAVRGQTVVSINLILESLVQNESFQVYYTILCIFMKLYLHHKKQSKLQASCIELLEILLEETDKKSSKLAREISEDLDALTLLLTMQQLKVSFITLFM